MSSEATTAPASHRVFVRVSVIYVFLKIPVTAQENVSEPETIDLFAPKSPTANNGEVEGVPVFLNITSRLPFVNPVASWAMTMLSASNTATPLDNVTVFVARAIGPV